MVLNGPINGEWFEAYVRQVQVPDLCRGDSAAPPALQCRLQSHRKAFAKLKALLRKEAERTIAGLRSLIGRLVDLFQPAECANCSKSCGYEPGFAKCARIGDTAFPSTETEATGVNMGEYPGEGEGYE
jgi:hypothetical protein